MRILWNNHRDILNPASGGAERTIHELGKRLVERGHEVTILTSRWKTAPCEDEVDGVRVLRYRGNLLPHFVLPIVVAKESPDVIVDDMAHAVPWASPWLTSIPGTVFFRHLHARTLPGQVSRPLARALTVVEKRYPSIYRSWPFVTESAGSVEDLVSLGIPKTRCVRIPPGVDSKAFVPRIKASVPTMVYFGGLRDYKRPDHALLVHKGLLARGLKLRLVVLGSGPSLDRLIRIAEGLGLEETIVFRGRVTQAELAEAVSEAWVNIHCSLSEGWGYSVMESAAAGTPTAAYRVRGIVDSVKEGESGLLAPDGDLELLTKAAEELMGSASDWVRRCRLWAERFTWEAASVAWERHLERIVNISNS